MAQVFGNSFDSVVAAERARNTDRDNRFFTSLDADQRRRTASFDALSSVISNNKQREDSGRLALAQLAQGSAEIAQRGSALAESTRQFDATAGARLDQNREDSILARLGLQNRLDVANIAADRVGSDARLRGNRAIDLVKSGVDVSEAGHDAQTVAQMRAIKTTLQQQKDLRLAEINAQITSNPLTRDSRGRLAQLLAEQDRGVGVNTSGNLNFDFSGIGGSPGAIGVERGATLFDFIPGAEGNLEEAAKLRKEVSVADEAQALQLLNANQGQGLRINDANRLERIPTAQTSTPAQDVPRAGSRVQTLQNPGGFIPVGGYNLPPDLAGRVSAFAKDNQGKLPQELLAARMLAMIQADPRAVKIP